MVPEEESELFALYIAKTFNCHVTGVDTGAKLSNMKAIGYDEVIDYKKGDFTKGREKYDLILDAKTCKSPFSYSKALHPNGKIHHRWRLPQFATSNAFFKIICKTIFPNPGPQTHNKGIEHILKLWEDGKIKP
ncbi:MAG: hypothetical protein R2784_17270 [Saprospiraceae bacterium]